MIFQCKHKRIIRIEISFKEVIDATIVYNGKKTKYTLEDGFDLYRCLDCSCIIYKQKLGKEVENV